MRKNSVSGEQGMRGASLYDSWVLSQHLPYHSAPNFPLRTQVRVALVDSDEDVHAFVRQAFKAHTNGWTLDSHRTPDSLVATLGRTPATPHPAPRESPASPDILQPHVPPDRLSTLPTINDHPGIPRSPLQPEVVLMETRWPDLSGTDCMRKLAARLLGARVVMFTAWTDDNTIVESVIAGACGCLIKPVAPAYLVWAVGEAAQGRPALCGEAQGALIDFVRRVAATRRSRTLSWRQLEVMILVMKGAVYKEIASKLSISEGTVHRHLHDIYKKLRVHRKDEARRKFAGK